MSGTAEFSAEDYFRTQPPPLTLETDAQSVREFIDFHSIRGNRVALVTVSSGDQLIAEYSLDKAHTLRIPVIERWDHSAFREECVSRHSSSQAVE